MRTARCPHVALGGVARGGALVERCRGERVQPGCGLETRIPVLRHVAGPGRRGRVGEGISLQSGNEGNPVVRCKTTNVERLELAVASGSGLQVRGEHGGVGGQFLPSEGGRRVGLEPVSGRMPVKQRLLTVSRAAWYPLHAVAIATIASTATSMISTSTSQRALRFFSSFSSSCSCSLSWWEISTFIPSGIARFPPIGCATQPASSQRSRRRSRRCIPAAETGTTDARRDR